ncbi:MAG TPA: response regulator [Opitutaceae bacterium]
MPSLRPILLVEDNPNDVELTLSALKDMNIANEIVVANDGDVALDYLYRRGRFAGRTEPQPAVVLLDLKMPRVDGRETLRLMRSDEQLRTIPVVIFTSSREEQDVFETYRLGINAYVVKPVNFEDFVGAITQLGMFWAVLNEPPPQKTAAPASTR